MDWTECQEKLRTGTLPAAYKREGGPDSWQFGLLHVDLVWNMVWATEVHEIEPMKSFESPKDWHWGTDSPPKAPLRRYSDVMFPLQRLISAVPLTGDAWLKKLGLLK